MHSTSRPSDSVHRADLELPPALAADSVVERLLLVAGVRADHAAVVDEHGSWTFGELAGRMRAVAAAVHQRGLPAQRPIAVLSRQDRAAVAAIVGVAATGHPVVLLDPELPAQRMRQLIEIADACALVVGAGLEAPDGVAGSLPVPVPVLALETLLAGPGEAALPALKRTHDDAFLISFTSGSTGVPKGVISHQPVFLAEMDNSGHDPCCAQAQDIVLISLPLAFGGGYGWLLNSLGVGATCVVADARALGRDRLRELAARHHVTLLPATPSLLRALVTDDDAGRRATASLRVLTSLGEAVFSEDLHVWRRVAPAQCVITNEVGSSEAGKIARLALAPGDAIPTGVVPVGQPVHSKLLEVVAPDHPDGPALPTGSTGLLRITSRAISPGYFRADPADHARFSRPDAGDPSMIRLLTADLARWEADGSLRLLGRADDAVKIRGYLVEPAEVVAHLLALPGISDAAVQPVARADGRRELRAWVAVDDPAGARPSAIRRALAQSAPAWTVPARIAVLAEPPRNERGKVDQAALAALDDAELPAPIAPAGPMERALAALWAAHLGLAEVSVVDDFSELGGDSLTAVALTTQISELVGIEVTGGDVLRYPSVRELARYVNRVGPGPRATRPQRIRARLATPSGTGSTLVPLHEPIGAAPATVLCIAGAGGSAFSFVPLAALLREASGSASPRIIAAQARGLEHRAVPDWTLKAAARRHVADFGRSFPPEEAGVVHVIGHSVGGVIATEMARELQSGGYRIGRLWLLDTVLPDRTEVLAELAQGHGPPPLGQRLSLHARVATAGIVRRPGLVQRDVFWEHGRRLAGRHRLAPYAAPATLLHISAVRPNAGAWAELYTGDFTIEPIAGDHNSILAAPFVVRIADRVLTALSAPTTESGRP